MTEPPEIGHINFGGGVAEKYLGDGRWQMYRENERICLLTRYGQPHKDHNYEYIYTRPESLGGITTGRYWCDGLRAEEEPYPLCPKGEVLQ